MNWIFHDLSNSQKFFILTSFMDKSIVRDIESGCKTKENDIENKSIVVFCIFLCDMLDCFIKRLNRCTFSRHIRVIKPLEPAELR